MVLGDDLVVIKASHACFVIYCTKPEGERFSTRGTSLSPTRGLKRLATLNIENNS